MDNTRIDKLMTGAISLSALLILIGALLKLWHYSYGNLILYIGVISSLILSGYEIKRLKKIIKRLKSTRTIKE